MQTISKLFLLLLLFENISNIQTGFNQDKENAIEIKLGSKVDYDKTKNFFKFNYTGSTEAKIFFSTEDYSEGLYLTYPSGERTNIKTHDEWGGSKYEGRLKEKGTYYLEVLCKSFRAEIGGSFKSIIYDGIIDVIDLSKTMYSNDFNYFSRDNYPGLIEYRVSGLTEDKYVFFISPKLYDFKTYYPYYPGEQELSPESGPLDHKNLTVFEVYNSNTKEIKKSLKFFKFEHDIEYIIRIHCAAEYDDNEKKLYNFWSSTYLVFPLTNKNFITFNGEENIITSEGPMLGIINPNRITKDFVLLISSIDKDSGFFEAKTNETIENNFENLPQISKLTFTTEMSDYLKIKKKNPQTTVAIIIPSYYQLKTSILITDEIDYQCKNSYLIPAGKSMVISCEKKGDYNGLYLLKTFISNIKNMRLIYSMENEATDFIIQHYIELPIFVEKADHDQSIIVKSYDPTFALFGAENDFLFKSFYNFGKRHLNFEGGVNIDNYKKMTQGYFRINSGILPWFENYNAYLNQLSIHVNVYIKQLYGGTDIYECNAEPNQKDLTFLTTPISNMKCKNKKSIFNRLYSFDGTKIISGYINPDSYFDIYAEIDDDKNTIINISPIITDELHMTNTAKYLRKDVQYSINFDLNHMIKLDPAFNADIIITNGQSTTNINSQKPSSSISGKGFTIKSNNDAMVYFIGRFDTTKWVQKEIDFEASKGKIIKVSNVDADLLLDIGFEGYYPSTFIFDSRNRESREHYFDNIYEKLKEKLVPNEKVYIYHYADANKNIKIEYIGKNLENKNNAYNIFLIPANNEENSLIIYTYGLEHIIPAFYFCHFNTSLQLSFLGSSYKEMQITNDGELPDEFSLLSGDNKLTFKTNYPLIFSYLYLDGIDEEYFDRDESLSKKRIVLYDLLLEEVKDKNDKDNVIAIKFKPNYKQSSTRYIIMIAQQNDQNTLDTFKEPCYITGLLNQRPSGVKVDIIYDIGDNDSINAEVDITDILNNSNKYVVNIISQELRFERKINFYQPKEFNHVGKNPNADDDNGLSGSNLALAIVLPIVGVILIGVGVFFFCIRKGSSSSDEIEKLTNREIII